MSSLSSRIDAVKWTVVALLAFVLSFKTHFKKVLAMSVLLVFLKMFHRYFDHY